MNKDFHYVRKHTCIPGRVYTYADTLMLTLTHIWITDMFINYTAYVNTSSYTETHTCIHKITNK